MDEIPFGREFEQAVSSFTRKQRDSLWAKAKQSIQEMLASGTEPFFRVGMGERFFGWKEKGAGGSLWLLVLIGYIPLYWILPKWYEALGVIVAIVVMVRFISSSVDNEKALTKIRAEKSAYHTKSPGKSRWDNPGAETRFRIISALGILLTSPLAGIAYISSMAISANLKREQAQKIYNNYLDARDNKIEAEFIERALKGEVPAEITYLYAPLSDKYDEETQDDIAKAWVAGTPKSIAQPPQPSPKQKSSSHKTEPKSPQPTTAQSEWEERERDFVSENPPEAARKPVTEREIYGDSPLEQLRKRLNQNCEPLLGPSYMGQKRFELLWNLGKLAKRIAIFAVVIALGTAIVKFTIHFVQSHHKSTPVASAPITTERQQPAAPAVQNQASPTATPVVQPSGNDNFSSAFQAQQEQSNKERLAAQEVNQLVNQIKVAVTNENNALETFTFTCNKYWGAYSNRISNLPNRYQPPLWQQKEVIQGTFQNLVVADQGLLEKIRSYYPTMANSTKSKLQALLGNITTNFAKVENDRQTIFKEMDQLDTSIAGAEKNKGFRLFQ